MPLVLLRRSSTYPTIHTFLLPGVVWQERFFEPHQIQQASIAQSTQYITKKNFNCPLHFPTVEKLSQTFSSSRALISRFTGMDTNHYKKQTADWVEHQTRQTPLRFKVRSAGSMAERLTTNQEVPGSTPGWIGRVRERCDGFFLEVCCFVVGGGHASESWCRVRDVARDGFAPIPYYFTDDTVRTGEQGWLHPFADLGPHHEQDLWFPRSPSKPQATKGHPISRLPAPRVRRSGFYFCFQDPACWVLGF